jgi:hypothetical protein
MSIRKSLLSICTERSLGGAYFGPAIATHPPKLSEYRFAVSTTFTLGLELN